MTMTVKELIELLREIPEDSPIYFRGYACGSTFREPISERDIVARTEKKTGEKIVEILADWN